MGEAGPVSRLEAGAASDSYSAARRRLTDFLIRATLIESYHRFAQHGKPYPFIRRAALRPGASAPGTENPFQRGALILLLDGALPRGLQKHIRIRRRNEITADNVAKLAPDIDLGALDLDECGTDAPTLEALLDKLIDLDYALLFQQDGQSDQHRLTHMHVKVERLTDNAVRELGVTLGYIKRRLFEQGDAHVEQLERKFYEYYGFSANASGRKSAAAMAAQLLRRAGGRATVFSTSQEDCRLTLIDETDEVIHYVVVPLVPELLARAAGADYEHYVVDTLQAGGEPLRCIVVLQARFRRTSAAAEGKTDRAAEELDADWLELVDEAVMPLPDAPVAPVPIKWAVTPAAKG